MSDKEILWEKALLVGSVSMCAYFFYSLAQINMAKYEPKVDLTSYINNDVVSKSYKQDYNELTKGLKEDITPFKPQFFENIKFKGLLKNKNNVWVALFQTPDDKIISLKQGETYECVKVKYTDKRTCIVQIGNVDHRFGLK